MRLKYGYGEEIANIPANVMNLFSGKWGALCYVIKRGGVPLYVGMSIRGFTRPFDSTHHALQYITYVDTDLMEIFLCDNQDEATKLERKLIKDLKPTLNTAGLPRDRNRVFAPDRDANPHKRPVARPSYDGAERAFNNPVSVTKFDKRK